MARKAEQVGVAKVGMSTANTFALAVLAGAFIALGAIFATTVTAGGGDLPYGVIRLLGGVAFSLGLILVVVAGAELFTGNNLIVMAWAGRRVRTAQVLRNWTIVYVGNLAGALATAVILFLGQQYEFGGGAVGAQALSIAAAKTDLGFLQAIAPFLPTYHLAELAGAALTGGPVLVPVLALLATTAVGAVAAAQAYRRMRV